MTDYTRSELLNEVSKVFRAGLNPGRSGGTLNTATEYRQLLEMVSISLLLNTDSVFYIARLAANQLNAALRQEVAVLEDILVSLEDLSQIGSPVRDSVSLSNARTAVLALDASESVSNRPETQRFMRQMDTFASQLRKNLLSQERGGDFVRPREEAKDLIQANLLTLDTLHTSLLAGVTSLRDMLEDFLSLDVPSRVSTSVLSSVNSRLQASIEEVQTSSNTDNLAANRRLFLETLTNKISVKVLSAFMDPTEVKYRSPNRPVPSTLRHQGQVTGQGVAASILTSAGPWALPISAPLELSVSGEAPVVIDLNSLVGAVLNARNSQSYEISATARDLHVIVDPDIVDDTAAFGGTSYVGTSTYFRLGLKHLGSSVIFPDADMGVNPSDIHVRYITDMRNLQIAAAIDVSYLSPTVTVALFSAADEGAIGFQPNHVGAYIYDSVGNRLEIIRVLSTTQCVIDPRGILPNFTSGLTLRGQLASGVGNAVFSFAPVVTTPPGAGDRVRIGPTVKTARLNTGPRTAANIISDIQAETGVFDSGHDGAKLNWHMSPELVSGDPSRVCLRIRSKLDPFIQISGRFVRPRTIAGPVLVEQGSAHVVLGYREGDTDTTNLLTTEELVGLVGAQSGLSAEVVETTLGIGSLETEPLLPRVIDATANFSTLGVLPNDQIEITDGTVAGTYLVTSVVSPTTLALDRPSFVSKETCSYRIFREQVRISVTSAGPGSYLEMVSSPAELGLSTGITYSSIPTFEAVDKLGNKLSFDNAAPGDFLKVVGQTEVEISEVDDTSLTLVSGLPSTVIRAGFEIRSAGARSFKALNTSLTTFVESPNLLGKNHFDESVDAIDVACTQAILPGQNFVASRNQAKRMVSDLLTILTSRLLREDEYTAVVKEDPNNLEDTLSSYSAVVVEEVDSLLATLVDRKYDRAAALLSSGRFSDFYATDSETGSYGGAVMSASRKVVKDLPEVSRTREDFLKQRDLAKASQTLTDAETDFSDTEDEPEDLDL
jgi:hypothetical protein